MGRATAQVVKSELVIDRQKLSYFNQQPLWQRISWPNDALIAGARLSWMSDETGMRLYQDFDGDWGWLRLLELAEVRELDNSRYLLTWPVTERLQVQYLLRSPLGGGPLDLLKLKDFHLPKQVFEVEVY